MNPALSQYQIQAAYRTAANLVKRFGDAYIPTFQRLHDEIQKLNQHQHIKTLALSVADDTINQD